MTATQTLKQYFGVLGGSHAMLMARTWQNAMTERDQ
ncbi:hypothetical protein E2C01_060637 [Portunus trituberculatus]|uniref:Uncharacterized protein n=1 Tax=Portunus trituberculatus TaxID=210409 RepID=A0A5B7H9K3_PORTR|nr:hypothetical protein [Portunus trituberculatus]